MFVPPPLCETLRSYTQARLVTCLQASLLVHQRRYCTSARLLLQLFQALTTTPTRRTLLSKCRGSCAVQTQQEVKDSEVRGDGREGVVYNMWVYVTAAAIISALVLQSRGVLRGPGKPTSKPLAAACMFMKHYEEGGARWAGY